MITNESIGALAAIIGVCGMVPYIRDVLRGRVRPHGFSWVIWMTIAGINAAAQLSAGAGAGAYPSITGGLLCLCVAALSVRYGEKGITRSDWVFFVGAMAAIPLWIATDNPLWSVILLCFIDLAGLVPTCRKTWAKPHEEGLTAFVAGLVSYGVGVFAVETYSLTAVLYPVTLIVANTAFCLMVLLRRRRMAVA